MGLASYERRATCDPLLVSGQASIAGGAVVFEEVVDDLAAAGDSITKLTVGVAHLVQTGDKGWQVASAPPTRSRLIDISARAQNIAGVKQVLVVNGIDAYLAKSNPTPEDWRAVTDGIGAAR